MDVKYQIEVTTGFKKLPISPRKVKREKLPRGERKRRAQYILEEVIPIYRPWVKIPRGITQREAWLLETIPMLGIGAGHKNFLVAVASDLGLYPAPKWWRVFKKLSK